MASASAGPHRKGRGVRIGGPAAIGYSAETTIFRAAHDSADGRVERRLVLRSEVPEPAIYAAQAPGIEIDIEIQQRIMESVARSSSVPVAPVLGYEPDPSVIGTPFFVMDFVQGDVPAVQPPYTASGFFAEAKPEQRCRMISSGLAVLAEIHRIDWRSAGLQWLLPSGAQPTLARQLDIWERSGREALGDRRHELLEKLAERLPGDLTREEQLAIYEEAAGRWVEDLLRHEIFAAHRYCVIAVPIANRLVERGVR